MMHEEEHAMNLRMPPGLPGRVGSGLLPARRVAAISLLATVLLCVAGCPVTFEQTLPADLDPAMRYVLDHREAFAQPEPLPAEVGIPADPLDGVVGCWGSYEANPPDDEVPVRTHFYSVYQFGPDGSLTMWDVGDVGGYYAIVLRSEGRYEVLGNNTLSATVERVRAYNAATHAYEVFGEPAAGLQWLVTLAGNELRLRIVVNDHDAPGPADMVFRRMDCEP